MAHTASGPQAPRTPPRWLNRLMAVLLRTPGVQRVVGRGTALLTVTGRRTGRRYTTPVSYARTGDGVLVVSHVSRTWWRNLPDNPGVGLRLAGTDRRGTARVVTGDGPAAVALLRAYLAQQRVAVRAHRVGRDADGRLRDDDLRRVLDDTVVVDIALDPA